MTTRNNPWYEVGVKVDGAKTAEEALKLSGLDWTIDKRPAGYLGSDGTFKTIPRKYAIVRADTDEWLGQVGKNYKTYQNVEAFEFADGLADGGLVFDAAGTYRNGNLIYLAMRLPELVQILGEDPFGIYLFLTTSHDGARSIGATVTPVRERCTNMMPLSLRAAVSKWMIRHTSTAQDRLDQARNSLSLTFRAIDAFAADMEELAATSLRDFELEAAVELVLPDKPMRSRKAQQVVAVFRDSPNLADYRGTRYAGLQAFAEWLDWTRDVRTDNARFEVSFDGYGSTWRDKLYELLLAGDMRKHRRSAGRVGAFQVTRERNDEMTTTTDEAVKPAKRTPKPDAIRDAIAANGRVEVRLENPEDAAERKRTVNKIFGRAYSLGLKGRFGVSVKDGVAIGELKETAEE